MKIFMITAVLVLSSQMALSEESPRQLTKVEGFVVHNAATVSNFSLIEGTRSDCVFDQSGLSVTWCQLTGGSLTFTTAAGDTILMPVTQFSHFQTSSSNILYNHHMFRGIWSITQNGAKVSAPAVLTVIIKGVGSPSMVTGYLSVLDFNLSEQISGQIVN